LNVTPAVDICTYVSIVERGAKGLRIYAEGTEKKEEKRENQGRTHL